MKKSIGILLFVVCFLFVEVAQASTLYSEHVQLSTGWNVISTPRILESHTFSAAENSTNFDIVVLNSASVSGWSTLADIGQTEFTPLYGYFVNNKTGSPQTLTFNYKADVSPSQRLFSRTFSTVGWNSLGVANPTYAKNRGSTTGDVDNVSDIVNSLGTKFSSAIDFTFGNTSQDNVALSSVWDARTVADGVNKMNDLRETKAYAVYVTDTGALYSGFQNNSVEQCRDGIDNDGDSNIDFPTDPGCVSAGDNDESGATASLTIRIASTPSAQTIVSGGQGVHFATLQFDASQSGEDVRFSSLAVQFETTSALSGANILSSCQLFDGATALNTGSNTLNPVLSTSPATANGSFTLDNSVVVTKGTVKSLDVKCNITSGATGALKVGMTSSQIGAISATGVTSSNTVTPSGSTNAGQVMTLASGGSLAVSNSPSTPSYLVTAGGSSDVVSAVYKLRATNEDYNMTEIALTLTSGAAADIVNVSLWKGTTALGTVTFTGNATVASTTIPNVLVAKDVDTDITAKVTYGAIGSNQPATPGATVKVNLNRVKGTGASSGNTIYSTGSTSVAGVRLQKSYPTVAIDTLASTGVADGNLMKFKVTANSAGPVGIAKINFTLATSSANVSAVSLYGYTDAAYSNAIAGFSGGVLNDAAIAPASAGAVTVVVANASGVQIPAGTTYYFLLKGTVAGTASTYSVSTTLLGDSTAQALAASSTAATNFIWSPNSTTTTIGTVTDWTNGYGLTGLPAVGISTSRNN